MTTWSRMQHWDLVLPPSRPSVRELRLIARAAEGIPRGSAVAVMGSTPEFRDHLYELGFRDIYVLEKNLEFLALLSGLRVHKNREEIVQGDWLDTLPGCRDSFALVLSDLTMGNIEYSRRAELYKWITEALVANGLFYDKVLTHSGKGRSVEELVVKYRELPLNLLHLNHFSCEALFCSDLVMEAGEVDTTRLYDTLEQLDGGPRFTAFVREAQRITPRDCRWFYGRPWNLLERDYCPKLSSPENSWRVPIPVQTQEPPCGTSAVLTTTCATTEALA